MTSGSAHYRVTCSLGAARGHRPAMRGARELRLWLLAAPLHLCTCARGQHVAMAHGALGKSIHRPHSLSSVTDLRVASGSGCESSLSDL